MYVSTGVVPQRRRLGWVGALGLCLDEEEEKGPLGKFPGR